MEKLTVWFPEATKELEANIFSTFHTFPAGTVCVFDDTNKT
jgi:hypothetical protein